MPDPDLFIVKPDPADTPKQAAEKLVWSFLVLFENLVSARTLLKSLQEATLLVTPAPGQPPLAKGSETTTAEAFVKKLQVLLLLTMLLCLGEVKEHGLGEFVCLIALANLWHQCCKRCFLSSEFAPCPPVPATAALLKL